MNKKFLLAISTLVGTIVGVGIFGLPYVFYKAGILLGFFYLIIVAIILIIIHLFWAEISFETVENHRLVGYAKKYLGNKAKIIVACSTIFGFFGAIIAYFLLGSQFLAGSLKFYLGPDFKIYLFIFWIIASLAAIKGIKLVAKLEALINFLLIGIVIIFFSMGVRKINLNNLPLVDFKNFFLPYGVILFSLAGGNAVPELKEILQDKKLLKKAVIIGTLIPAVLYLLFVVGILGLDGTTISVNVFFNLASNRLLAYIGQIFGFLAVITSVFVFNLYLKKVFIFDFKLPKILATSLVVFIPFLFVFFFKNINFINVLEAVGVISIGIEGIVLVLIHEKLKGMRGESDIIKMPSFLNYLIMIFLIAAVIYYFVNL